MRNSLKVPENALKGLEKKYKPHKNRLLLGVPRKKSLRMTCKSIGSVSPTKNSLKLGLIVHRKKSQKKKSKLISYDVHEKILKIRK